MTGRQRKIENAFILAAGLGSRLRPLTETCPKPLVPVRGKPIIDHVLDHLKRAGVKNVTVNLHHLADRLAAHLESRRDFDITLSFEPVLLDTGGGMKNALGNFGSDPFFTLSGDWVWTDPPGGPSNLDRLAGLWREGDMDLLLLLQPLDRMVLTEGTGDYAMQPDGRLVRARDKSGPYMWTSVRVCDSSLFRGTPDGPFSFLTLMDRAEEAGCLYGVVADGEWHHISTLDDLRRVESAGAVA